MRMWGVIPELMCRMHLCGEHVELHMFHGCLTHNKPVMGYLTKGLIDLGCLHRRHDAIAAEMTLRGYKHTSMLHHLDAVFQGIGYIDLEYNYFDLMSRCPECSYRIHKYKRGNV